MFKRYLFGPVTAEFARQNLHEERAGGRCVCFGSEPGPDVQIGPRDSWEDILTRLGEDRRPELLVLHMQYNAIPADFWAAPVPIVALAGDWSLQYHGYRRLLRRADLVLTDTAGVEAFTKDGIANVRPANLFGLPNELASAEIPAGERDIDVLFVGNFHPAVHAERLPWVGRLAQLSKRWHVVLQAGVNGPEYRQLLARARIVFNRAISSECNSEVFEAIAAGALLFQEAGNCEVPQLLGAGEYVAYNDDDLEARLEHYLANEPERARIAAAAHKRLREFTYAALWRQQLERIDGEWPRLLDRAAQRAASAKIAYFAGEEPAARAEHDWIGRVWQAASCTAVSDAGLRDGLKEAVLKRPRDAALLNAFAVATLETDRRQLEAVVQATLAFQDAWAADARHAVAGFNLAEALCVLGQRDNAHDMALRVLAGLDELPARFSCRVGGVFGAHQRDRDAVGSEDSAHPTGALDDPLYPQGFNVLRVEWERAAWLHAGDPRGEARAKLDLLRWRLHSILGELTGELLHHYETLRSRPDLPATRASLGAAMMKRNHPAQATEHLEAALRGNPFDNRTAALLHDAYGSGAPALQQALIRARRLLHAAALGLVPLEPWFAEQTAPALDAPPVTPPLRIVWQGAQEVVHSLSNVNRGLCGALLARGHELSLVPQSGYQPPGGEIELPAALAARKNAALAGPPDVHVMHQWPPDFNAPPVGRWVIIQPWEFGSIPKAWVAPLRDRVDELWVPSQFVRRCYIQSGVPEAKVHVVPNGVADVFLRDHDSFVVPPLGGKAPQPPEGGTTNGWPPEGGTTNGSPCGSIYPLKTRKRFKFLFVGGTTHRKGFDILLKAYRQVFCAADDVCLVVKDMGVGTFYRGQTAAALIEDKRKARAAPEVEYISDELSETQMAALYRACDCAVQPYRGEGFCLPVAEAMACGLPVIVTGYGPSLDYCTDETSYLLPYYIKRGDKRVDDLETVDHTFMAEPQMDPLRRLLRHVFEHPEEARERGARARQHVRSRLTWAHAAAVAEERLAALRDCPLTPVRPECSVDLSPHYTRGTRRPRVSLTMIVRNEEKNLEACLASIADLVDEIIIVDTGSIDKTVQIAERFGAKVFHFKWIDDFAAARTEALRHATGEWIIWMDADDRFDAENREKLRELFANLPEENVAFNLKCHCLPNPAANIGGTMVRHLRIFRNLPGLQWEHRLHEQILPALKPHHVTLRWPDIVVNHVGYMDPAVRKKKQERDLRILLLDYAERPDHPFTLFNLGNSYHELGRIGEALEMFQKSLSSSLVKDSIVAKLYTMIAKCQAQLNRPGDAATTCRVGLTHYPEDGELLFQASQVLRDVGDRDSAIGCLERLIAGRDGDAFISVDTALRGYKARQNLGTYYQEAGRLDEAATQWRLAVAEEPGFLPAILCLGDLALARQDWPGLEDVIARLAALPPVAHEADVYRARAHLIRGNPTEALATIDRVLAVQPRHFPALFVRAKILFEEGRDWAAVEQALRAVLDVAPNNAEARQNLEVALRHTNRGG